MNATKSWACQTCKKRHVFGVYVAGHVRDCLVHTCVCGAVHHIQHWRAKLVKPGAVPSAADSAAKPIGGAA